MVHPREAGSRRQQARNEDKRLDAASQDDHSRALLLECRIEWLLAGIQDARAEADRLREKLAYTVEREADQSRRLYELQEELSEAHAEILELNKRMHRLSSAGGEHMLDEDRRSDDQELIQLRKDALVGKQRYVVKDSIIKNLRRRLEEMSSSRDRLFARISEWQSLVREDGPEAVDLAEFIAELRHEILSLEGQQLESQERERLLRDSLSRCGVDPDVLAPLSNTPDASSVNEGFMGLDKGDAGGSVNEDMETSETVLNHSVQPSEGPDSASPILNGSFPFGKYSVSQYEDEQDSFIENGARNGTNNGAKNRSKNGESRDLNAILLEELCSGRVETRLNAARRLISIEGSSASSALARAIAEAPTVSLKSSLLILLGRTRDHRAMGAVSPWLKSSDTSLRAAAYEAAASLLEGRGDELISYLRAGLSDSNPIVRRRCVLATGTARNISKRSLLEQLQNDPDPGVRRVARRVLATLPPAEQDEPEDSVLALTIASGFASNTP